MKKNKVLITVISIAAVLCICAAAAGGIAIFRLTKDPTVQAGISRMQTDLSAMAALREKLMAEYPSENISVQLKNGSILEITLENPVDASLLESISEDKAKDIARFTIQNYPENDEIKIVAVNLKKKVSVGIVSSWKNVRHAFPIEALR